MRYLFLIIFPFFLSSLENTLQFRIGYLNYASSTARKIYDKGSIDFEIEDNIYYYYPNYSVWTNVNFAWKKGQTQLLDNSTYLYITTLSAGPKFFFPFKTPKCHAYLGVGLSGAFVHIRNKTIYIPRTTNRWSIGCVGKVGFLIDYFSHGFWDLFLDYYYQPVRTSSSVSNSSLNLGGLRVGIGFGF